MLVALNFPVPILLDLFAIAILIFSLWRGKKRGFIKTVAGILVLVLAFAGAGFLAKSTAPSISEAFIEPHVANFLEPKADSVNTPSAFYEMLLDIGVPEKLAQQITDSSPMSDMLLNATVTLSEKLTYAVLSLIYFIVLLIVLNLLVALLDRIFHLPVLNSLNGFGGIVCGGISGYLLILLFGTIFLNVGLFFDATTLSQTRVLNFIINTNPFSLIF